MSNKESALRKYWTWYGGFKAIYHSWYFRLACIIALLGYFISPFHTEWWDVFISIIPNLLGFSIGAYALVIGLGNEKFLLVITGSSVKDKASASPFLSVSATFIHFIIVQTIAIFLLLFSKALYIPMPVLISELVHSSSVALATYNASKFTLHYLAIFFAVYALLLVVSAALHMLTMTSWIDQYFGSKRAMMIAEKNQHKNQKLN